MKPAVLLVGLERLTAFAGMQAQSAQKSYVSEAACYERLLFSDIFFVQFLYHNNNNNNNNNRQ